jgi:uncharacterized membrane-anchored protein YitT (DUF2179 family)
MKEKKGFNWLALFFAPYYYAGYGQLNKGIVLAVISGILPIFAILVGIYGGLKANKELPIGEKEFNWKNVVITIITLLVVSIISMTLINALKG